MLRQGSRFMIGVAVAGLSGACTMTSSGSAWSAVPQVPVADEVPVAEGDCAPSTIAGDVKDAVPMAAGNTMGCWGRDHSEHAYALPRNTAPGGALYELKLILPAEDTYSCVYFYDQDRKKVGGGCGEAGLARAWATVAPETAAYMVLDGGALSPGESVAYEAQLQVTPLADPGEPDNSQKEARTLKIGAPQLALAPLLINSTEQHYDWYAVKISKGGQYELLIADVAPKAKMAMEVYDPDHNRLDSFHAGNGGANLRATWKVKPGRYYVKVSDRNAIYSHDYACGRGEVPARNHESYAISVARKSSN